MMRLNDIELKQNYPYGLGRGAKPGYACKVTLQFGDRSYDTIKVELTPDAARAVIALAVEKAVEKLVFDQDSIQPEGSPPTEIEPPEFAEVDEAPAAVLADVQPEEMF